MPWAKGKSQCETSVQESSTNPSLAKTKLSTQKGNAVGATAKAAAQSKAVPAVVNWNVLETAPPPPTRPACYFAPAAVLSMNMGPRLFPDGCLIWLCGQEGTALLRFRVYWNAGTLCVAPLLMSGDKMVARSWALSSDSGEGSSLLGERGTG